jgi:Ca-activated chloride channel homolog
MVDGVNDDAINLAVSDGQESCRGNPCAAAVKPRLIINLSDIACTGAGHRAVAATKGQVFTARIAVDVVA